MDWSSDLLPVDFARKSPVQNAARAGRRGWRRNDAKQGMSADGVAAQRIVVVVDGFCVFGRAAQFERFAFAEIERGQGKFGWQQIGSGFPAIERGVFERLLVLENLDAFLEAKGVGVALRDAGDAIVDGAGFEADVLDREKISEDGDEINSGDGEQTAHPDAIDELLAIANGDFGREKVGGGFASEGARGGKLRESIRGHLIAGADRALDPGL